MQKQEPFLQQLWNNIAEWWRDHNGWWLDFVFWLTDTRNSQLGILAVALIVAMLSSVILTITMILSRPKLALERSIGAREAVISLILINSVVSIILHHRLHVYALIGMYILFALASAAAILFLFRERLMDDSEVDEYIEDNYDEPQR